MLGHSITVATTSKQLIKATKSGISILTLYKLHNLCSFTEMYIYNRRCFISTNQRFVMSDGEQHDDFFVHSIYNIIYIG